LSILSKHIGSATHNYRKQQQQGVIPFVYFRWKKQIKVLLVPDLEDHSIYEIKTNSLQKKTN
jgi:hypothetical protein